MSFCWFLYCPIKILSGKVLSSLKKRVPLWTLFSPQLIGKVTFRVTSGQQVAGMALNSQPQRIFQTGFQWRRVAEHGPVRLPFNSFANANRNCGLLALLHYTD
jgi:hypothetical protein